MGLNMAGVIHVLCSLTMCFIELILETSNWIILAQDVFSLTYASLLDKPKSTLAVSSHFDMADGGKDGTWLFSISPTESQSPSLLGYYTAALLLQKECRPWKHVESHTHRPGYE